jgi:hypothetical protein
MAPIGSYPFSCIKLSTAHSRSASAKNLFCGKERSKLPPNKPGVPVACCILSRIHPGGWFPRPRGAGRGGPRRRRRPALLHDGRRALPPSPVQKPPPLLSTMAHPRPPREEHRRRPRSHKLPHRRRPFSHELVLEVCVTIRNLLMSRSSASWGSSSSPVEPPPPA